MATARCLLSVDRLLCSVCLDVFKEPVSTPCGHNFCRACIYEHWDNADVCQCPLCRKSFPRKPELRVNTVMSELAAETVKMAQVIEASTGDASPHGEEDVLCDICCQRRDRAVKSCLVCLTSFCQAHLEPHHRVPVLRGHKLIDPISDLQEKLCQRHGKLKELYCRADQAFICFTCFKTNHRGHDVVPLDEQYEEMMSRKDETMEFFQREILSRYMEINEVENSLVVWQKEAEKEKEATVQLLAELVSSVLESRAHLVAVIKEKQSAAERKAEGLLRELRTEIEDLESRSDQLEQLSETQDHHRFVQNFPDVSSPSDSRTQIDVSSEVAFKEVTAAVLDLKRVGEQILEGFPEIRMRLMREHAVDVTLDTDTAHRLLAISWDGKRVSLGAPRDLPDNPERFLCYTEVLGTEGFTSNFYFEVQVKDETDWAVGVARESVDRKGHKMLSVHNGYYSIGLDDGKYQAYETSPSPLTVTESLQTVGVFVDYEKGTVSFYNALSSSHVFSFGRRHFMEKLYPYFNPDSNGNRKKAALLIITPVPTAKIQSCACL